MNKEELHRYVRGILGQPEPIHFAHSMIETLERALASAWDAGSLSDIRSPNPWRKQ